MTIKERSVGLLLGENNDLVFDGRGRVIWTTGATLVRQRWKQRVNTPKGSWVLDNDFGIPYKEEILRKGTTERRIKEIFRIMTNDTFGVVRVVDIIPGTLDVKTRSYTGLTVNAIILDDNGEEVLNSFLFARDLLQTGIINIETQAPVIDEIGAYVYFRYIAREGGIRYSDYCILYEGTNITLEDYGHGIRINSSGGGGSFSLAIYGGTPLTESAVLNSVYNVTMTQVGNTISVGVGGLTESQLIYGSASGRITQSSNLVWTTYLYVNGDIDVNDHALLNLHYIDMTTTATTGQARRVYWDSGYEVLAANTSATLKLRYGVDTVIKAYNVTGAQMNKDLVAGLANVYDGYPAIEYIDIDNRFGAKYLGIINDNISDMSTGFLHTHGIKTGIDTAAFDPTDVLWLGYGAALTRTRPNAPAASIRLGYVLTSNVNGTIYHRPEIIPYLSHLSDVNARNNPHTGGDVLAWDASNTRWDLSTSVSSLQVYGSGLGPISNNAVIYEGANIYVATTADGFVFNAIAEEAVIVPTSVTLNVGTYVSGSVTDIQTEHDGNFYVVTEADATPGLDIELAFAPVMGINRYRFYYNYTGVDTLYIQLYNWDTLSWNNIGTISSPLYGDDQRYIDLHISSDSDYIDVSNNALMRVYKSAAGNPSATIYIEYASLVHIGASGGGQATLAATAIGYGASDNTLTGNASYLYYTSYRQVCIGASLPTYLGTDNDSLLVDGPSEYGGVIYAKAGVTLPNDQLLILGTAGDNTLSFSTDQTTPSSFLQLSAPHTLLIGIDSTLDYGYTGDLFPELVIFSGDTCFVTSSAQYLSLGHNGSGGLIKTGYGSIIFYDACIAGATNWTVPTPLFNNTTEPDSLYTLLGGTTGSIAACILAASSTARTFQQVYDASTSGANITLSNTIAGLYLTNSASGSYPLFSVTQSSSASLSSVVSISNASDCFTVELAGNKGTEYGVIGYKGLSVASYTSTASFLSIVQATGAYRGVVSSLTDIYQVPFTQLIAYYASNYLSYVRCQESDVLIYGDTGVSLDTDHNSGSNITVGGYYLYLNPSYRTVCDAPFSLGQYPLMGLKYVEFNDVQTATVTTGTATLNLSAANQWDLNLNNQSTATITLTEPAASCERATYNVIVKQGGTTATTTISWASSGSANIYPIGTLSIPTALNAECMVIIKWDQDRWLISNTEAFGAAI